jgi:hypothetical protein
LFTPNINTTFTKPYKQKVRNALGYLTTKLASFGVKVTTVFVVNRDILCAESRRGDRRPAYRFRIVKKTRDPFNEERLALNPCSDPASFSETEIKELKKLGGDLVVTYHDYERDGLGPLYLGEDETIACQKKRDERLQREREKRELERLEEEHELDGERGSEMSYNPFTVESEDVDMHEDGPNEGIDLRNWERARVIKAPYKGIGRRRRYGNSLD